MKLKRFRGSGIHGFLSFDIKFNKDLTFLIGINGSGKTTVLNCVTALISPSLHQLAVVDFSNIRVDLEHDGASIWVSANKEDHSININASNADEIISFKTYSRDIDIVYSSSTDHEQEYYRDRESEFADHPVMKVIYSLPTPMFLGLDRRAQIAFSKRRVGRPTIPRSSRNVFSPFLSASLVDAAGLAENRYHDMIGRLTDLEAKLRRSLLLELISLEPAGALSGMSAPTRDDVAQISKMKENLNSLAEIFTLERSSVSERMIPFLESMQEQAKKIPNKANVTKPNPNAPLSQEAVEALFFWNFNRNQLRRVQFISELLREYNEDKGKLTADIDKFADLTNQFLEDSGKYISFDTRGRIYFRAKSSAERKIPSLSSGEAQIFVILSHLFFNPAALGGNVFIVDEPEISLHIQWQELFVRSIMNANANVQYILATHSPSIIYDNIDKCVDLSTSVRDT